MPRTTHASKPAKRISDSDDEEDSTAATNKALLQQILANQEAEREVQAEVQRKNQLQMEELSKKQEATQKELAAALASKRKQEEESISDEDEDEDIPIQKGKKRAKEPPPRVLVKCAARQPTRGACPALLARTHLSHATQPRQGARAHLRARARAAGRAMRAS